MDAVVEPGHQHPALRIVQRGNQLAQRLERVVDGSPEGAGVQVGAGTADLQLQGQRPPERVGQGWAVRAEHPGVGGDGDIGDEVALVAMQEGAQARAADLFLSLEQADHVDRQPPSRAQQCLDGLDVAEQLALVVARPSPEELGPADLGGERWRAPLAQRVDGLDVVMAVDQHGRTAGRVPPGGKDSGWRAVLTTLTCGSPARRSRVASQSAAARTSRS